MYQFWYCFQYKYMVQNIIFWPVYSQLGSKSRPLLVRNFGLCTSQIVVYDPKLRYENGLYSGNQPCSATCSGSGFGASSGASLTDSHRTRLSGWMARSPAGPAGPLLQSLLLPLLLLADGGHPLPLGRRPLPARRMRFVASTNKGASSFQPLADAFIEHNASYNVASAYCSSPGPFIANTTLPDPPFCWNNWTVPIRAALPDAVHLPIIQLLGSSGPAHFKDPQLFAMLYTEWAVKYSFDGFLIDAEARHPEPHMRAACSAII